MRARNRSVGVRRRTIEKQRGAAAVEFALVALAYFMFVFGMIEVARAMYICNTLQEVTRRAAAAAVNKDFTSTTALSDVRVHAIFRDSAGTLAFAEPITNTNIRIDYLSIARSGGALSMEPVTAMPSSPAQNRLNCASDPNGASCIRLVRVRVCATDGAAAPACDPVPYQAIVQLIPFPFPLPISTTIMPAETLGL